MTILNQHRFTGDYVIIDGVHKYHWQGTQIDALWRQYGLNKYRIHQSNEHKIYTQAKIEFVCHTMADPILAPPLPSTQKFVFVI